MYPTLESYNLFFHTKFVIQKVEESNIDIRIVSLSKLTLLLF